MPYKDPAKQAQNLREWRARQRAAEGLPPTPNDIALAAGFAPPSPMQSISTFVPSDRAVVPYVTSRPPKSTTADGGRPPDRAIMASVASATAQMRADFNMAMREVVERLNDQDEQLVEMRSAWLRHDRRLDPVESGPDAALGSFVNAHPVACALLGLGLVTIVVMAAFASGVVELRG